MGVALCAVCGMPGDDHPFRHRFVDSGEEVDPSFLSPKKDDEKKPREEAGIAALQAVVKLATLLAVKGLISVEALAEVTGIKAEVFQAKMDEAVKQ